MQQNNIQLQSILQTAHAHASGFLSADFAPSDYIPGLASVDASLLGCAVLTTDGRATTIGDWQHPFTMQSISKVISLLFALKHLGREYVFARVGVEPSGDPYNCFIKLETAGERPFNPFINAGAITTISMLTDKFTFDEVMDFSRDIFGASDGEITVNDDIFTQEKRAGKRNRSMAYLMASKGAIDGDAIDDILDFYFKLCAVNVNAMHLAHMGAVLANGGKSPHDNTEIAPAWSVKTAKAIMLTCGMYDGSGEFAVNVGLPAKSGIGGGIVACGGALGIGTFGPALDAKGNSVGGINMLQYLSETLALNLFQ